MAENKPGGYELHHEIGEKEMEIFKAALKGVVGFDYKPVAVASQIVAGVNYLFICTGKPVVAKPVEGLYVVKIFAKLPSSAGADFEIKDIKELDLADLAN
jgi:hypothetical protein